MYGGISFCRHLKDTLFRPTFMLSFAGQWPWFPSIGQCPAAARFTEHRQLGIVTGYRPKF